MKRFFILASAAIVALASCAKTEVVYKDGPQEISFKKITGVMTKATTLTGGNLGVFANQGESVYFGNTSFGWDATNLYYKSDKTWPLEGTLDFTVYYPYNADAAYTYDTDPETNLLTIPVAAGAQIDGVYYGAKRYTAKTSTNQETVILHHACAKITVKFDDDNYTFVSATVNGVNTSGTVSVDYSSTPVVTTLATPTPGTDDITIASSGDFGYALPGDQTSITVTFKQKVGDTTTPITRNVELGSSNKWEAHKHYTYNVSVAENTNYITFTAQTEDWVSAGDPATPSLPLND